MQMYRADPYWPDVVNYCRWCCLRGGITGRGSRTPRNFLVVEDRVCLIAHGSVWQELGASMRPAARTGTSPAVWVVESKAEAHAAGVLG
jgi:hypothetical protein